MIKSLFAKLSAARNVPPLAPDHPFVAVGDIHGCVGLLQRFLDTEPPHPIICVGDYVDRGDHSAEVLRLLHKRLEITCLSGNHEVMLLNFLKDPEREGPRWLRHGGLQTLASFGVAGVTESSTSDALHTARDQLRKAMGADLIAWLDALPTRWQSGNVAVVHAGADPAQPIGDQHDDVLHWGHRNFARTMRTDGVWIVHGHTIVDTARATRGRIAIDTGAYATGRLTTALIAPGEVTFQTIT